MEYKAHHYYADVTARKLRLFADMIRGMRVDEALEALRFHPNRGARQVEAVLKSAVGNAQYAEARDVDELVVKEARIDGGPMMKRIHARARGMAYMVKKRLAHIHITVADEAEEPQPQAQA